MSISSPGLGSNLDVNSIVSKLMSVESQPLSALNKKEASFQARLSAFGLLKSTLANLRTAASAISTPEKFQPTKPTVSNPSIFTATSLPSAAPNSYQIEVQSLAQAQKLRTSTGYTNVSDVVGTGKLTISFGSYNAGSFSPNPDKQSKSITIDGTNNTLAGIRDSINKANTGVTASIINDGTKSYLALGANDTGLRNSVKISVETPLDDTTLQALAFDQSTDGLSNLTETVAAKDAVILVDNIKVTKPSNVITDAIQGVTLTLAKEAIGQNVELKTVRDVSTAQAAVQSFVKAYNDFNKTLKDATAYNTDSGRAAALQGDGTARLLQTQLRSVLSSPIEGAPTSLNTLSGVGVQFQKDGTLSLDATKLSAALADPGKDVSQLFAGNGTTQGYGWKVELLASRLLSPVGTLASKTNGLNDSIADIGRQRTALNKRLDALQTRYLAQFNALDTTISKMTQTSNYLTQQLTALMKQRE